MVPARENRKWRASPRPELCSPSFWLFTLCLNWANTEYKSLYFPQVSHFISFVPQNYDLLLLLLAPRMVHFSNLMQKSFLFKVFWDDPWGSLISACLWASWPLCPLLSGIVTYPDFIELHRRPKWWDKQLASLVRYLTLYYLMEVLLKLFSWFLLDCCFLKSQE